VFGIDADNIAEILFRFPEIRMMLIRVDPGSDVVGQLISRIPEALGLFVACACGADLNNENSEKIIEAARRLTVGEQWQILEVTLKLTFPQGVSNFLAGVQGLLGQADVGRGRAPATRSPAPSNSASSTDTTSDGAESAPRDS
jgi:hypothetical protein